MEQHQIMSSPEPEFAAFAGDRLGRSKNTIGVCVPPAPKTSNGALWTTHRKQWRRG